MSGSDTAPDWLTQLRARLGEAACAPRTAVDAVNAPMIRRWCEAMGERNPLYLDDKVAAATELGGLVAPPAMLEVWTMGRFRADGSREGGTLLGLELLDAAGFSAVVATNLEQEYLRYLRPGDVLTQRVTLEDVSAQKPTALGAGHFVSYRYEFCDQHGQVVGRMRFRILKFRPAAQPAASAAAAPASAQAPHPRPPVTADSAFFWEALKEQRLLIRKCARCGRLQHPPGPMCPQCQSLEWTTVEASGRGHIHSYVIVHQPQLPGFIYPLPVALVDLEEGVRLIGNVVELPVDEVRIGMPVEAVFRQVEPGYSLYAFRARAR
jgi:uncharacterized protein